MLGRPRRPRGLREPAPGCGPSCAGLNDARPDPAGPAPLCGSVVWGGKSLDEGGKARRDTVNPDPRKQGRLPLGHPTSLGPSPNAEGRHEGRISDGDNGKSDDVTIWSETPSALSVRGCRLAVPCGTRTWPRVGRSVARAGAPGRRPPAQ
ncbi:DUF2147 domain-containing protein [Methylobacterium planeticum]|uniref:DUF2147 domain-containing protein n=1 Tax=Methylobacterium planeticum TaxID=2615211 RepID=UPI001784C6F9|nr:DUF2147 domain-containing protein [Methylobacterium planeticum]